MVHVNEHELVLERKSLEADERRRLWAGGDQRVVAHWLTIATTGQPHAAIMYEVSVDAAIEVLDVISDGGARGAQTLRHVEVHLAAQLFFGEQVRLRAFRAGPIVQLPQDGWRRALLPWSAHIHDGAALAPWIRDDAWAAVDAV